MTPHQTWYFKVAINYGPSSRNAVFNLMRIKFRGAAVIKPYQSYHDGTKHGITLL